MKPLGVPGHCLVWILIGISGVDCATWATVVAQNSPFLRF